MKLGIGIDTGGTYTDAVIYNFKSKEILASAKALTTKDDLERGILNAIDQLPSHMLKEAKLISLSTTLATNVCVEDRVSRAKLIYFGSNKTPLEKFGSKYGLPPVEEILFQDCVTTFEGENEKEPDWQEYREAIKDGFDGCAGVGIVEFNATMDGAVIEKKAKEIMREMHRIPVVCGHELFSELNSLQRSSSTLLNAGLFPVIDSFLDAIRSALKKRGIEASVVIVRSNGSLMTEEFASEHPVETLLCGPAASVLGSAALCDSQNSIVVDMGGTTTDIALISEGTPVSVLGGVQIGKWKTFVDGLYIKTIGLGGDSAIHYEDGGLKLEPYRVMPICMAAAEHPSVKRYLKELLKTYSRHTRYLHEHYILIRDIGDDEHYTEEERALSRALAEGPLSISDAAKAVGKDVYTHDASRLVYDGVIQRCGLTPTDIMHIRGDFTKYDREAAELAAKFVAANLDMKVEVLCREVYRTVEFKIYLNVIEALLENKDPRTYGEGVGEDLKRFLKENYMSEGNPLISSAFRTDYKLIGIGAPTHIFLDNVAKKLGTEAVMPKYAHVANALGAIVGKVAAGMKVNIRQLDSEEVGGFMVYGIHKSRLFDTLEEAVEHAIEQAKEGAELKVRRQGAVGEISVSCSVEHNNADTNAGSVYLGSTVMAKAVGYLSEI